MTTMAALALSPTCLGKTKKKKKKLHHTWQHLTRHLPSLSQPITCSHQLHHTTDNRNRRQLAMSFSGNWPQLSSIDHFELSTESDFSKIVSPDGLISICGFGSLLSVNSARSTFPNLINFRVARLRGFRRVFAHAAPIFFQRGIANPQTKARVAYAKCLMKVARENKLTTVQMGGEFGWEERWL